MPSLRAPEDARMEIVAAWFEWKRLQGFQYDDVLSSTMGFEFFAYLQSHRPELLDFEYQGDKWQIVHSWLVQEGQVN